MNKKHLGEDWRKNYHSEGNKSGVVFHYCHICYVGYNELDRFIIHWQEKSLIEATEKIRNTCHKCGHSRESHIEHEGCVQDECRCPFFDKSMVFEFLAQKLLKSAGQSTGKAPEALQTDQKKVEE